MLEGKDIRFTEKKVDQAWKSQVSPDKEAKVEGSTKKQQVSSATQKVAPQTSQAFLNLVNSLAYQAMMFLGEIPPPDSESVQKNLEAAREMIDLLSDVKKKTDGNLGPEELEFFQLVLPELQLKYAQSS